ncbi:MAG TPA: DNA starvation/stationary phase protection protein Dps [Candidatus Eisenbacteria bacterium]|nr:DNA starvation/stationary phase protection protein Dps [Candidatus Eisenbacteria bacterium]
MHKTRNDLPKPTRTKMIDLLNARLADAIDLYAQVKQAHWNVKGMQFIALHELFDKVAESVEEGVDEIAERAVELGGTANGTLQTVVKRTTLAPYPLNVSAGKDHVKRIADALAAYGRNLRAAIATAAEAGDADTSDLFTEISRAADKQLWFVEAHLQ